MVGCDQIALFMRMSSVFKIQYIRKLFIPISDASFVCVYMWFLLNCDERGSSLNVESSFCLGDNLHCLFLMLLISFTCSESFVFISVAVFLCFYFFFVCAKLFFSLQFEVVGIQHMHAFVWFNLDGKKITQRRRRKKTEAMNYICVCLMSTK